MSSAVTKWGSMVVSLLLVTALMQSDVRSLGKREEFLLSCLVEQASLGLLRKSVTVTRTLQGTRWLVCFSKSRQGITSFRQVQAGDIWVLYSEDDAHDQTSSFPLKFRTNRTKSEHVGESVKRAFRHPNVKGWLSRDFEVFYYPFRDGSANLMIGGLSGRVRDSLVVYFTRDGAIELVERGR